MKKPYEADKLSINKDQEGLSLKMVQEHFKLYEGYVKKSNEIQEKVKAEDKSEANAVYSRIGELKRQETFAVNGMKLHEIYFGHLSGDGKPRGELVKLIEKRCLPRRSPPAGGPSYALISAITRYTFTVRTRITLELFGARYRL